MTLVRKYTGTKKAVLIRGELFDQVVRFANKEKFVLGSVIETALEEFLEDRDDDDREKSIATHSKGNGSPAAAAVRK